MMEEYSIPEEILSQIPEQFWSSFRKHLLEVFEAMVFDCDEAGMLLLRNFESTYGWYKAFRASCADCDLAWLRTYYGALPWYDSDQFDSELGDELLKHINI